MAARSRKAHQQDVANAGVGHKAGEHVTFPCEVIRPISIAELNARGVIVTGINNVVIDTSKRHLAECF